MCAGTPLTYGATYTFVSTGPIKVYLCYCTACHAAIRPYTRDQIIATSRRNASDVNCQFRIAAMPAAGLATAKTATSAAASFGLQLASGTKYMSLCRGCPWPASVAVANASSVSGSAVWRADVVYAGRWGNPQIKLQDLNGKYLGLCPNSTCSGATKNYTLWMAADSAGALTWMAMLVQSAREFW